MVVEGADKATQSGTGTCISDAECESPSSFLCPSCFFDTWAFGQVQVHPQNNLRLPAPLNIHELELKDSMDVGCWNKDVGVHSHHGFLVPWDREHLKHGEMIKKNNNKRQMIKKIRVGGTRALGAA